MFRFYNDIIDNRESSIERIKDDELLYVDGDVQDKEVPKEAGIAKTKGLICTISHDQDNAFTTFIARELNPELFILVRTNHHHNKNSSSRCRQSYFSLRNWDRPNGGCKKFRTLEEKVSNYDFIQNMNPSKRNTKSA